MVKLFQNKHAVFPHLSYMTGFGLGPSLHKHRAFPSPSPKGVSNNGLIHLLHEAAISAGREGKMHCFSVEWALTI